ncbi:hypothetical protein HPB52_003167 [Rhipicephalus sanguineus]|uniref:Uncharacterized protein n=1 Tax=Rhipicephalus sanguineus TaxID=34632 RepID=A0A9D4QC54_RHISA|nr:hypothetical protein HPB52_003167 [Rhipicephalus sanguineus]
MMWPIHRVVSPSGNVTSQQPLDVKEERPVATSGTTKPNSLACSTWNATVSVKGSVKDGTIEAAVNLFEDKVPQCEHLSVALWKPLSSVFDQSIPCAHDISIVDEKIQAIANLSVVVKFDDLSAGNYCVRVTPRCNPPEDCLTLTSKVIELPAPEDPTEQTGGAAAQSSLLWLLLLPLLAGAAVVIALGAFWVRRQSWLARNKPFVLGSPLPMFHKPRVDRGPPDSADLGHVSEINVDELYHTTYTALLSNHAQAFGDYCDIMVARLPYTTLPDRLDLVP